MCRPHWMQVPGWIRSQVWSYYRAGQCDDMNPSKNWHIAATRAILSVAVREGMLTKEQADIKMAREIDLFGGDTTRVVQPKPARNQVADVSGVSPPAGCEDPVPLTSALSPPLRYVGGKRWLVERLVPEILSLKPKLYVEPFLGAGAIALGMPREFPMVLSDASEPLMNLWLGIQRVPKLVGAMARSIFANCGNTREGYLLAREHFNSLQGEIDEGMAGIERAALMLYLNATGYNGVWRENSKGRMNVPFGDVKHPSISTDDELIEISHHLAGSTILCADYAAVIENVGLDRTIVFADSPYHGGFDDYIAGGFSDEEHRKLAEVLHDAVDRGVKVFATNADTEFIRQLYSWAKIENIEESRNVAQKVASRKAVGCLLIRG